MDATNGDATLEASDDVCPSREEIERVRSEAMEGRVGSMAVASTRKTDTARGDGSGVHEFGLFGFRWGSIVGCGAFYSMLVLFGVKELVSDEYKRACEGSDRYQWNLHQLASHGKSRPLALPAHTWKMRAPAMLAAINCVELLHVFTFTIPRRAVLVM